VFNYLKQYVFLLNPLLSDFHEKYVKDQSPLHFKLFYAALFGFKLEPEPEDSKSDEKPGEFAEDGPEQQAGIKDKSQPSKEFTDLLSEGVKPFQHLPYKIKFINKDQICLNCCKKGEHSCPINFQRKPLPIRGEKFPHVNISVELPAGSQLTSILLKVADKEKEKPLVGKKQLASAPTFSIASSLDTYFEAQRIERKCKHCGTNDSLMSTSISRFPKFLVLHLKRFTQKFEKNNYVQVKLEEFVDFDFELKFEECSYQLFGIINHKGDLDHGHYTSFSFNHESKEWVYYDDAKFEPVENLKNMKSKENYILVYEQCK
jgi:hypothetical protein